MMDFLSAFHLLRPWWLLLLLPAIALWWLERRAGDRMIGWARVIDPELLKHLIVGRESDRRLTPGDVLLVGGVIGIVAFVG